MIIFFPICVVFSLWTMDYVGGVYKERKKIYFFYIYIANRIYSIYIIILILYIERGRIRIVAVYSEKNINLYQF